MDCSWNFFLLMSLSRFFECRLAPRQLSIVIFTCVLSLVTDVITTPIPPIRFSLLMGLPISHDDKKDAGFPLHANHVARHAHDCAEVHRFQWRVVM